MQPEDMAAKGKKRIGRKPIAMAGDGGARDAVKHRGHVNRQESQRKRATRQINRLGGGVMADGDVFPVD